MTETQELTASQKTAAFIQSKRQVLGFKQSDLAKIVFGNPGLKSYICNIETGKRDLSITSLAPILIALKSELVLSSLSGGKSIGCEPVIVAKFIRKQRLNLGISQTKLARIIYGEPNMRSYISNIETGKKEITVNTLGYFLNALKSDISFNEN